MSTAIRINRLRVTTNDRRSLAAAERHGKREDTSGKSRRVRQVEPLVVGGLNLTELYWKHVQGTDCDKRTTAPVLHCLIQWPVDMPITPESEKGMLDHSTAFLNKLFGGEAVFAARLDRDEAGQHTIDVFCTPIVTKKSGKRWVQPNVHLKNLTEKHEAEIRRRYPKAGKDITSRRFQGIALQSEWRDYLQHTVGLKIKPKVEKATAIADRVSPEAYGRIKDQLRSENDLVEEAKALLSGDETKDRRDLRHHIERAECGLTTEEALAIDMPDLSPRPFYEALRERVVAWWKERILQLGAAAFDYDF